MIAKRFLLAAAVFYSATAGASAPVEPTLPPPEYPDIADMKTDKRESLKKVNILSSSAIAMLVTVREIEANPLLLEGMP